MASRSSLTLAPRPPLHLTRRAVMTGSLATAVAATATGRAAAASGAPTGTPAAAAPSGRPGTDRRHICFHGFRGPGGFRPGRHDGTEVSAAGLVIGAPTSTRDYADPFQDGATTRYGVATWTSPLRDNGFGLTELISSWNANTPNGTWVEVQARGWTAAGSVSGWYVLGRWCSNDPADGGAITRTSVDDQGDDLATVWTDTVHLLNGNAFDRCQLRVHLMRRHGGHRTPTVTFLGAVCSALPDWAPGRVSEPLSSRAVLVPVPPYSQELHHGEYPQWGGGGESWCSPTSTSMTVASWGRGPTTRQLSWVETPVDPQVDFAARNTFDAAYDGCGNWPFNTAYAGRFGLEGFVTRLRSLREAELFVRRGIPLVTSIAFAKRQLDGAGYSTDGHLMVLRGFTADGDPVVNDPASHLLASDAEVQVTYRRDQFERRWLTASGGTVYVIHPVGRALPPAPTEANW